MDTLDTIIKNLTVLSNTKPDWSMGGGLIWFTFMATFTVLYITAFAVREAKRERAEERKVLYAHAEDLAHFRLARMYSRGYLETRNF